MLWPQEKIYGTCEEGNMIEQKLREYKSNLSKLKLIECSMKQLENEIQVLEPSYISAYSFSDTPTGKTYKISSPVENTVLESENKREKVDKLKDRLWDMAKERNILQYKVEEVEAYLTALGAEERFIIEQYFFERLSEPMIASKYQKQFNIYKNIRTLRRKRFDAIRKMESISKSTKCPQNVLKMS
jgi:hypothetical protein